MILRRIPFIPYKINPSLIPNIDGWIAANLGNINILPFQMRHREPSRKTAYNWSKQGLGWAIVPYSYVRAVSNIYKQPIFSPSDEKCPLLHPTNLLYRPIAEEHAEYSVYLNHFKKFFSSYSFFYNRITLG